MIGTKDYRSGIAALAAAAAIFGAGCDQASEALDQCVDGFMFECNADGIVDGNASVTGLASVDGFFTAVLGFEAAANGVAGGIKGELEGIRGDFGLDADGEVGALLKAKLDTYIDGDLSIRAEPARCEVDAQASFEASAQCQADVGCDVEVNPGMLEFECKGGCELDVNAKLSCSGDATLKCEVQAPSIACEGSCQGSCTVDAGVTGGCTGSCGGSCSGTCNGTCDGATGSGVACEGTCAGTCTGTCDVECDVDMQVAAECQGSCSGTCTAEAGKVDCDAAVSAKCEGSADASVMCTGKCDGDFTPPSAMVDCDASASCNASAKAEASFNVECTPPSVEIDYQLKAGLSAELEAEFKAGVGKLRTRLPKLLASLKKGELVVAAGGDLVAAAGGAVNGVLSVAAKGDVKLDVAYKLASCAPAQFTAASKIVKDRSADLTGQLDDAVALRTALSM